jgi:hypothetical protein
VNDASLAVDGGPVQPDPFLRAHPCSRGEDRDSPVEGVELDDDALELGSILERVNVAPRRSERRAASLADLRYLSAVSSGHL